MTADRVPTAIDRSDLAERTVQEAQIALGAVFREAAIDTPTLDARLLIAAACGIEPADVITQGERRITPAEESRLLAFAERRLAREPVARILGYRHFHGLRLDISPATLDPRPETETLVDGVLDLIKKGEAPGGSTPRLLDAGTGSGAILIALLHALPGATGVGVDCSAAALAVAQRNAHLTSVGDRAAFLVSDWLAEVRGEFDIIVANPPYIPTSDIVGLDAEVVRYDPLCALDGGTDGLAPYRRLIPQAMAHLALGGWLVVETGEDQTAGVAEIAKEAGSTEIRVWLDLGRKPRCVAVRHH